MSLSPLRTPTKKSESPVAVSGGANIYLYGIVESFRLYFDFGVFCKYAIMGGRGRQNSKSGGAPF